MKDKRRLMPIELIQSKIVVIRGEKVMIDHDLAELYGVETGVLNRAVKRNLERFPKDFMFQLLANEWELLRCQTGISKESRGGRRYLPYAFTEQGVAMLSSVLNSKTAIEVNIAIMRAFVQLRKISYSQKQISRRLREIEVRLGDHDEKIEIIFEAILQLLTLPEETKNPIGFEIKEPETRYRRKY
jgi:phage regulator Rha-like protein